MSYEAGKVLREVRAEISRSGASEANAMDLPTMQHLFGKLQELKNEMNEAKREAAAKAAEPYLELMKQIEYQYAMILKLKGK